MAQMFFVIYEIALHILALILLPKMLYRMVVKKRYRESLALRLGIGYPRIEKKDRQCIWVHAVSVGETKAVAPLVKRMRQENPHACIVISSITETGHAEAKKSIPEADHHVYLPFDFSYVVRPIVKRIKPDLLVLCETDFWYHFQSASVQVGAKLVLVNGKISERSMERHQKIPWVSRHLFASFDLFCLQSPLYAQRFETMGIPREKIAVTGNLKLDDEYPFMTDEGKKTWLRELGIGEDQDVLVIGSTHDPEEREILGILHKVWERYPNLRVILAPRHPDRCLDVEAILKQEGLTYIPYSRLSMKTGDEQVILIDRIGLLRKSYQVAYAAIVAGTYTDKIGGHNVLEPSWYGVPVLCGPHLFSQPDFQALMEEYGSGRQVPLEGLADALLLLLENRKIRDEMGQAGLRAIKSAKGATARTWEAISKS